MTDETSPNYLSHPIGFPKNGGCHASTLSDAPGSHQLPEHLNNLPIYTKICKLRLSPSSEKNMMSLEIS